MTAASARVGGARHHNCLHGKPSRRQNEGRVVQVAVYWAVDPDILCTSALLTESIRPIYPSGYDDCLVISVVIGKEGPFIGDPVQVRGLVAHHPRL